MTKNTAQNVGDAGESTRMFCRTDRIFYCPFSTHFTAELVKEAAALEAGMSKLHDQVESLSNQVFTQKNMPNGEDSETEHLEQKNVPNGKGSEIEHLQRLEEKLDKLSRLVSNKLGLSTMVRFKTHCTSEIAVSDC